MLIISRTQLPGFLKEHIYFLQDKLCPKTVLVVHELY